MYKTKAGRGLWARLITVAAISLLVVAVFLSILFLR